MKVCALRRRIGAHEVELQRIGRTEALHHADRHRKEREIGRDRRLRRDAGDVELVEDDDDHRRERDDRDGLRGDDPRHHRPFEPAHRDDENGKPDAERRADREADQRLFERDRAMIDEAALRGRRGGEDELVEFGRDLMRRRQLRPLHVERRADEVLRRIVRRGRRWRTGRAASDAFMSAAATYQTAISARTTVAMGSADFIGVPSSGASRPPSPAGGRRDSPLSCLRERAG